MQAIRHLLAQRHLAVLLCAAALLLRLLVPTGYMIGTAHGDLAIVVCPGTAPATMTAAMPEMHGAMPEHGDAGAHGKAQLPCAFAGLSAAMLGAIDPIQLAALIAFVLTLGRVATHRPVPAQPAHLRPPLRGPPASL